MLEPAPLEPLGTQRHMRTAATVWKPAPMELCCLAWDFPGCPNRTRPYAAVLEFLPIDGVWIPMATVWGQALSSRGTQRIKRMESPPLSLSPRMDPAFLT